MLSEVKQGGTIAIVNCVPYHYDIVLGTAFIASSLGYSVDIYGAFDTNNEAWPLHYRQKAEQGKRAMQVLHPSSGTLNLVDCMALNSTKQLTKSTAVVFITAQEEYLLHPALVANAIKKLQPATVLAINHYGSDSRLTYHHNNLNISRMDVSIHLSREYPSTQLLTLSPLNLDHLQRNLHASNLLPKTDWLLPVLPLAQEFTCSDPTACPFAIQGTIDPSCRDYQSLFHGVHERMGDIKAAKLHVRIIGQDMNGSWEIPSTASGVVSMLDNITSHDEYYYQVSQSLALIPFTSSTDPHGQQGVKVSSSLVMALVTGVPVLADKKFQMAHSFVPPSAFYLQEDHESVVDAMLRVMRLPAEQHLAVRRWLAEARSRLVSRNQRLMRQWLQGGGPQGKEKIRGAVVA